MFEFVRFLVAQNLADVNMSDCLIDWTDRQMLPRFMAPLTTRGRQLVDALQAREAEFVKAGKMQDGKDCSSPKKGSSAWCRNPTRIAYREFFGLASRPRRPRPER
jgi:hypothetical protein